MNSSPNPFSDKAKELEEETPQEETIEPTFYKPSNTIEPEAYCKICGAIIIYTAEEKLAGTIKKYCSKECRKNRNRKG